MARSKPILGRHPQQEALRALVADDVLLGLGQVLPRVEPLARMRHQHLRLLLEGGGDDAQRDVLRHGVEGLLHVAAHVEVDLAGQKQRPAGDLRSALHDRHVEAAGGIGAVGDRLVVAAMLGLGEPVGAEGDRNREGRGAAEAAAMAKAAVEIERSLFMNVTLCLSSRDCARRSTPNIRSKRRATGPLRRPAATRAAERHAIRRGIVPIFQAQVHVAPKPMLHA